MAHLVPHILTQDLLQDHLPTLHLRAPVIPVEREVPCHQKVVITVVILITILRVTRLLIILDNMSIIEMQDILLEEDITEIVVLKITH